MAVEGLESIIACVVCFWQFPDELYNVDCSCKSHKFYLGGEPLGSRDGDILAPQWTKLLSFQLTPSIKADEPQNGPLPTNRQVSICSG